ncbi:MAG: esterase family protein [Burkholderiales bacterium]|nr:esterase family protein [Burkholderiales bacterium]
MRPVALVLGAMVAAGALAQPLPRAQVGHLERLPGGASKYVAERPVDVWLPRGYDPARRYDVLYMQDGQMLFDAATTWNHQAWHVDVALQRLIDAGEVPPTIVVGVWNGGAERYAEYFPQKALALASEPVRRRYVEQASNGRSKADDYLRFLVEELKPEIDRRYATRPGPAHTFVMGSSMGGLIALYAMSEYPQVFGGAACLSTHWVGRPTAWGPVPELQNAELPLAVFGYLRDHAPDPATHRLYMDHGTAGLDALYGVHQRFADLLLRERGYGDAQYSSRVFQGADHTEADWAARVGQPLRFLLGPDLAR